MQGCKGRLWERGSWATLSNSARRAAQASFFLFRVFRDCPALIGLAVINAATPSKVRIEFIQNDPESIFFSSKINQAFSSWKIETVGVTYSGTLLFGPIIIGTTDRALNLVRAAFIVAGIPFATNPPPEGLHVINTMAIGEFDGKPDVTIIVGSKPRNDLSE
jgi:hypothetical protein